MKAFDQNLFRNVKKIYLIGIGGAGMSALARVLKHQGFDVCGSDIKQTALIRDLENAGIPVTIGQNRTEFTGIDLVIYSTAIPKTHIEFQAALKSGCTVSHRAEILSSLLNGAKTSVAVTGTHGKTTTTSMLATALQQCGKSPTCLVGSEMMSNGRNTLLGESGLWVAEVDESDKTHKLYSPNYTIVTNLEEDHLDHYRSLKELEETFVEFLGQARDPGLIVYYDDDKILRHLMMESTKPRIGYGFSPIADLSAQNIHLVPSGSEFEVFEYGFYIGSMQLSVPGEHNIANALAVTAILMHLGLDFEQIAEAMKSYTGVRRRLEVKYSSHDVVVVDDYAHHPTEIKASLAALRQRKLPVTVLFQPHRFSRTKYFFKEFAEALLPADKVVLTDIYSAGETDYGDISSETIYRELIKLGHVKVELQKKNVIVEALLNGPALDGVFAFMGAGDLGEVADEFANRVKSLTTA